MKKWLMSSHEHNEISYTSKYSLANLTNLFKNQTLKPLKDIDNETIVDFFTIYNIKEVFFIFNNFSSHYFASFRSIPQFSGIISKFFQ